MSDTTPTQATSTTTPATRPTFVIVLHGTGADRFLVVRQGGRWGAVAFSAHGTPARVFTAVQAYMARVRELQPRARFSLKFEHYPLA